MMDSVPHNAHTAGGKHAREGRFGAGGHAQFKLRSAAQGTARLSGAASTRYGSQSLHSWQVLLFVRLHALSDACHACGITTSQESLA